MTSVSSDLGGVHCIVSRAAWLREAIWLRQSPPLLRRNCACTVHCRTQGNGVLWQTMLLRVALAVL
jgi:hypothetical protein